MERLPVELCVRIFCRLDHQNLAAALQVCRKWKVLASDDALWSNLFRERWGEDGDSFYARLSWKAAYKAQVRCDRLAATEQTLAELEARVDSLTTRLDQYQARYELLMSTLFLSLGIPFPDAP